MDHGFGIESPDDEEIMQRDRAIVEKKYWNIGYQRAIFETRLKRLQQGFDDGFFTGAASSFLAAFFANAAGHCLELEDLVGNSEEQYSTERDTYERALSQLRDRVLAGVGN